MRYQRQIMSKPERRQPQPKTGQEVRSVSGLRLGLVARLLPKGFVLTSSDGELPLTTEAVFTSNGQTLTLVCEKAHLHDYLIPFWELRDKPKNSNA